MVVSALGTTVKVLARVLGDPEVVSSLVVEVLDVFLEPVDGNIVPMDRQEARGKREPGLTAGGDLLVGTVGSRVTGLNTARLEVEDPLETAGSRGGGGTTESDTL